MKHKIVARCVTAVVAVLLGATGLAQTPAVSTDPAATTPVKAEPTEPPPSSVDANGKALPVQGEVKVLADPDTKMYMPCRDPSNLKSAEEANPDSYKPNPKAMVITEESAKQHGFKASVHKVKCPD